MIFYLFFQIGPRDKNWNIWKVESFYFILPAIFDSKKICKIFWKLILFTVRNTI